MLQILNIIGLIRLPFKKRRKSYFMYKRILGFFPKNLEYYDLSITPRSACVFDSNGHSINNERLEYLGDSVLNSVVSDYLFRNYPQKDEGFLSSIKSKIVKRGTLNRISVSIGLQSIIKEGGTKKNHNSYIGGNALEAFIAAIYLDKGYHFCRFFIENIIIQKHIDFQDLFQNEKDFKSKLYEWGQKHNFDIDFRLKKQSGSKSDPYFTTQVYVEGIMAGEGNGYTKKESQQDSAKNALMRIGEDHSFVPAARSVKEREAIVPNTPKN